MRYVSVSARLAITVLALALLLASVFGILWWAGTVHHGSALRAGALVRAVHGPWWPWAVTAVSVILLIVGIKALLAPLHRSRVPAIVLPGSSYEGRLEVDASAVMDAASALVAASGHVRSAHGQMKVDRGELVGAFELTLEPGADIGVVRAALGDAAEGLRQSFGRDDVHCRFVAQVAK